MNRETWRQLGAECGIKVAKESLAIADEVSLAPCASEERRQAASAIPRKRRPAVKMSPVAMGHVWTAPAVQEESDVSAKRSGAAMYPACFRLEIASVAMQPQWPLALM